MGALQVRNFIFFLLVSCVPLPPPEEPKVDHFVIQTENPATEQTNSKLTSNPEPRVPPDCGVKQSELAALPADAHEHDLKVHLYTKYLEVCCNPKKPDQANLPVCRDFDYIIPK